MTARMDRYSRPLNRSPRAAGKSPAAPPRRDHDDDLGHDGHDGGGGRLHRLHQHHQGQTVASRTDGGPIVIQPGLVGRGARFSSLQARRALGSYLHRMGSMLTEAEAGSGGGGGGGGGGGKRTSVGPAVDAPTAPGWASTGKCVRIGSGLCQLASGRVRHFDYRSPPPQLSAVDRRVALGYGNSDITLDHS